MPVSPLVSVTVRHLALLSALCVSKTHAGRRGRAPPPETDEELYLELDSTGRPLMLM